MGKYGGDNGTKSISLLRTVSILKFFRADIAKTSDFGSLLSGASITVDGTAFTVRDTKKENDGVFCRLSLSKN